MKHLAFLSFTIATLVAPIQVQAQTNCVRFPQKPNRKQNCGICCLIRVPVFVRHRILIWQDRRELCRIFRRNVQTIPSA